MNAYMTSGTLDYLVKVGKQYPNFQLSFMKRQQIFSVYYESEQPSIFESGNAFEVIVSTGKIQEEGFVVMNNIPVTEEGKPIFEAEFKQRAGLIDHTPGFHALRVLRPYRGNTYIVMIQWKDESSYKKWKQSDEFIQSHPYAKTQKKKKAPFAAGPSYTLEYNMVNLDEE